MTSKKAMTDLFDGAKSGIPGRHLSHRISPEALKRIKEDMKLLAGYVAAGAVKPSFADMVKFIHKEHGVHISVSTIKQMYRQAEGGKNG